MEDAAPNTDLATGTAAHNMEDAPCAAPFTIFYATEPRPDWFSAPFAASLIMPSTSERIFLIAISASIISPYALVSALSRTAFTFLIL